ncbi:Hypothetical protein R9X50_00369100 [Acrodontium crateriforme]|uniref:Zn(2)-C6 fungal-type domain-containing protein n=1 Tax=Acrodontium crateriforme TaxID=150365 RepID=A0AAQ3M4R5_9PEZI|nr:Hypothetical protein R9X50_00369100 [Acrodontium crateriforme]
MDAAYPLHDFDPAAMTLSHMPQYAAPPPPPQHRQPALSHPQHAQQQHRQQQPPPQPPPAPPPPQDQWHNHQDSTDRARAYKSRNKRPCDFCRYKKAACHLETHPPCELCQRYNKECTFVESPAKRRRPNNSTSRGESNIKSDGSMERGMDMHTSHLDTPFRNSSISNGMDMQHHGLISWEHGLPQFQIPAMTMSPNIPPTSFGSYDSGLYQDQNLPFDNFDAASASTPTMDCFRGSALTSQPHQTSIGSSPANQTPHGTSAVFKLPFDMTSGEPSLDNQAYSNAQIVGTGSGEADPYLFARYRFDPYNEASFQSIRVRRMTDAPPGQRGIPTFFTIAHNGLASKAQPPEYQETLDRYRRDVDDMVSDDVGKRLLRLFYTYVQPYCPLLSRHSPYERDEDGVQLPSTLPTSILAAIYGHALAFCAWDEQLCVDVYTPPSADALFKIAWLSCLPMFHTPTLAVLQTLLLLVQRRPTNKYVSDTPFKWAMMATAVSVAQALGINRDPSNWPIPAWEIQLRKRLGWATFCQDKWLALNFGRSSHIQADDWDVSPLNVEDFSDADYFGAGDIAEYSTHFMKLCELTVIVDDIMHSLFSIRAARALHDRLECTLEVAKPLRLRLTDWYRLLPPGLFPQATATSPTNAAKISSQQDLDGNGSLQLAYITAKIELFRAMLRPRVTDANVTAVNALRNGAIAVAQEVLDFLQGLNAKELEAFWAGYARTNFTIASSFMLLLFATSPSLSDATRCLMILNAWRSLLRLKSRSCDLLNLALLCLDGVYVAGFEQLIDLSPAAAQAWAESNNIK